MKETKSIIDIIKKRQSKRKFIDKELSKNDFEQVTNILKSHTEAPFGNKISFSLIEKKFANENYKIKLGTYGFISGAKYFIVCHAKQSEHIFEDAGYLFEKIILDLTKIGLGTCWLGGTFKRSDFSTVLKMEENVIIPAISPVGYPTPSKSVKEKIIRWGAKSDRRKEWSEIFFNNSFDEKLTEENANIFAKPLEMLRLAPSASNKQPWRILLINKTFHFYLSRTPGYKKTYINSDLQLIDMGIAMSHFELTCKELNIPGGWQIDNPNINSEKIDEYIISWKI